MTFCVYLAFVFVNVGFYNVETIRFNVTRQLISSFVTRERNKKIKKESIKEGKKERKIVFF
jgi:hypothetical protein